MKLPPGKVPLDILREVVFKNLGAKRSEVTLGASPGIDAAIVEVGNKSLVVSMDPITGALERIGWLAVNVNANDIATFGVEPAFLLSCMLLPEKSDKRIVETISLQMDKAAKELGIAIVGGHCEATPGLANPIIVGCVMGVTERGNYVTAGMAKAGDRLILTKSAGIEGTAILASDRKKRLSRKMAPSTLESAENFYGQISVVKDALTAFRTGGVHAMHDPTEGGVAGGIHEMADASSLGASILEDKIRISPETQEICDFFHIDPLCLISSGALLIAAEPGSAEVMVKRLGQKKIPASVIGEFQENPRNRKITRKNGKTENLQRPLSDHLWRALSK